MSLLNRKGVSKEGRMMELLVLAQHRVHYWDQEYRAHKDYKLWKKGLRNIARMHILAKKIEIVRDEMRKERS